MAGGEARLIKEKVGGQAQLTTEFDRFIKLKPDIEDLETCRKTMLKRKNLK